MEKEIRDEIQQFQTARKNEQLFGRVMVTNPKLLRSLVALTATYSPSSFKSEIPNAKELDARTRFFSREAIISLGRRATYSLDDTRRSAFFDAIDLVIQEGAFGEEWKETLVTFIMVGILCPPIFNLFFMTGLTPRMVYSEPFGKHRMTLVLNPKTSIADIKNAWRAIKKMQRASWPKFKDFNVTKTSEKRLLIQFKALVAKNAPVADKEKYKNLDGWEISLLKNGKSMKEVREYRAARKIQGMPYGKSIAIKRKKTDADFIKQAQPHIRRPALKKAVNQFRQEKSRMRQR